jgi:PAS domain S-box-containing protein
VICHPSSSEARVAQWTVNDVPDSAIDEEPLAPAVHLQAIFQWAPVGIALLDRDGRYLAVNPMRQDMLGYSEAELIGRHYLDVTHPDDIPLDRAINSEARTLRKDHYQFEKRFLRRDGTVLWSRMTIAILRDERGEHNYSIAVAEDITERKLVEEERDQLLRREHDARVRIEQLAAEREAILGQIVEGIIIADPSGAVAFVNAAAARIHGEPTNPAARLYAERYHVVWPDGEPIATTGSPLTSAAQNGVHTVDAEWIVRRPDGAEVIVQGGAAPVVGEDGTRLGGVLSVRDVTALRRLEAEKDDFLSAAAHDLRTPLATIRGSAQILQRRLERGLPLEPASLLAGLNRIQAAAGRMTALVEDLLDVANIQIGNPTRLARQEVDLVSVMRGVVDELSRVSDHPITVATVAESLVVYGDAGRLERVLSNLLSNAIKYSPDSSPIDVRVDGPRDGNAILTVADQGVGIPPGDLQHIFERFRRGENVAGRIHGTGIGLAAVYRIVEQHGGSISVESVLGEGSTFTVTLPIGAEVPVG